MRPLLKAEAKTTMACWGHLRKAGGMAIAALLLGGLSSSVLAGLKDENLLISFPNGFKLGWQSADGQMQEFVQPPETVDGWSRMITIQIFHSLKNADPNAFAERLEARWASSCAEASAHKVRQGVENGYPIAVWLYICPLNRATHKPETMYLKGIGGVDSLYVAQYAYRQEPSKEMIAPAMDFLRKALVCDTRREDRQCPASLR